VDGRGRHAQHAAAQRHHPRLDQDRHGDRGVGRLRANGRDITFPDGRTLFMGSSGTGAPRDGKDPNERPRPKGGRE
jgi:hypothetical protein